MRESLEFFDVRNVQSENCTKIKGDKGMQIGGEILYLRINRDNKDGIAASGEWLRS